MRYFLAGLFIISAALHFTGCSSPGNLDHLYTGSTIVIKYQDDYQTGEFHRRLKEFKSAGEASKIKPIPLSVMSKKYSSGELY